MPRPATRYCFGRIPGSEGGCSVYQKVMDGEAWTHAVVSAAVVIEMDNGACRKARIVPGGVAPILWRVPAAERLLTGQKINASLAAKAAEAAIAGANPLPKNKYKVPVTREILERGIVQNAGQILLQTRTEASGTNTRPSVDRLIGQF